MHPDSRRHLVRLAAVLAASLVLAGCDPDARDDIADAIGDAVSDAQSAIDEATSDPTTDPTTPAATEAPTTDAPAPEETTEEPAPEPEPTPEETAAPAPEETTAEPEPTPEPTEEPTEDAVGEDAEDGPPWLLIAAIAALLALLIWAFVAVWRRRQAMLARRARLRDAALADVDWLLGTSREHVAGVDAAARARDVRLRQDRLTETLQQLRADASDDVLTTTTAVLTSSRHLTDALIARLDDAASGRGGEGSGLGVPELGQRLLADRDDLARSLGATPEPR